MKKALLILLMAILLLPACCQAEKSAVLVIADGMGSSYIYPEHAPTCIDGTPLPVTSLAIIKNARARYDLWVPTPKTESGNAVIIAGYSGATQDVITYFSATIYDALRKDGYLTMPLTETGDNADVVRLLDILVHDRPIRSLPPTLLSASTLIRSLRGPGYPTV
jgi:2,3-bisphosphoglycerate-independent phosphoglycerate mutase